MVTCRKKAGPIGPGPVVVPSAQVIIPTPHPAEERPQSSYAKLISTFVFASAGCNVEAVDRKNIAVARSPIDRYLLASLSMAAAIEFWDSCGI